MGFRPREATLQLCTPPRHRTSLGPSETVAWVSQRTHHSGLLQGFNVELHKVPRAQGLVQTNILQVPGLLFLSLSSSRLSHFRAFLPAVSAS